VDDRDGTANRGRFGWYYFPVPPPSAVVSACAQLAVSFIVVAAIW